MSRNEAPAIGGWAEWGVRRGLLWMAAGRHRSPKHPLSGEAQATIRVAEESCETDTVMVLSVCASFGGRGWVLTQCSDLLL